MSNNKKLPVIMTENFLTVIAGKELTVTKNQPAFAQAVALYKAGKFDDLVNLLDRPAAIERYTSGKIKVYDGVVTHNGQEVHGSVVNRILDFVKQGLPFAGLVAFLNKLYENNSEGVREKLYTFLENNHLGITEDGNIIVFKLVKADGSPPMHPGTFFETQADGKSVSVSKYRIGFEYTYPREQIKEGTAECGSVGLYVANRNYWGGQFDAAGNYTGADVLLIGEVNPRDVCNVARSESAKMVVCKFKIIGEYKSLKGEVTKALYQTKPDVAIDDLVKAIEKTGKATRQAGKTLGKVIKTILASKTYGVKPSGQKFHNLRDSKGHFKKKR